MRKSFDTEFMAKVALDAIREEKTPEPPRHTPRQWRQQDADGLLPIAGHKAGDEEKERDVEKINENNPIPPPPLHAGNFCRNKTNQPMAQNNKHPGIATQNVHPRDPR